MCIISAHSSAIDIPDSTPELEVIENHPSYHGVMTGTEAELRLEQHGRNAYLTRYTKLKKLHKLSVVRRTAEDDLIIQHFTLCALRDVENGTCVYKIDGSERYFSDIDELLSFYKDHRLTPEVDGIGECLRPDGSKCLARWYSVKHSDVVVANSETAAAGAPLMPRLCASH